MLRLLRTVVATSVCFRAGMAFRTTPLPPSRFASLRRLSSSCISAQAEAPAIKMPTLDERLVAEDPEMVKRALEMRRAPDAQLEAVDRIAELTKQRAAFVEKGMKAREKRRKLSAEIGKLMKAGGGAEVDDIKAKVAACATDSDAADAEVEAIESERAALFNSLPNLLDPRLAPISSASIAVLSVGIRPILLAMV